MGCVCSRAVAAATQDDIDQLTSKKVRRQDKNKKRQPVLSKTSPNVPTIAALDADTVHEAR